MQKVLCGLDNLAEYDSLFAGKRIGLLTMPAAVNQDFKDSIEVFHKNYNLTALFSPEHGVRGDKQAGLSIDTYTDDFTGVTVYSIYGKDKRMGVTPEMTDYFDVLVCDLQDVGSRFYTYLANIMYSLEVCAKAGKTLVVLDRPNPIGGEKVEGNMPVGDAFYSLVCCHNIPQRFGLTVGELAKLVNEERGFHCDLHVVPLKNYKRSMYWDDTGLSYINASPNLPNLESMVLYNGTCYFEGTAISEGRGTTRPFELIGAPWLDAYRFAEVMNGYHLPGVKFRPTYFTPTFSKHKDEICQGVQIHVLDKRAVNAAETGLRLLDETRRMSGKGDGFWRKFQDKYALDGLSCFPGLRDENLNVDQLLEQWKKESAEFQEKSKQYYLYD